MRLLRAALSEINQWSNIERIFNGPSVMMIHETVDDAVAGENCIRCLEVNKFIARGLPADRSGLGCYGVLLHDGEEPLLLTIGHDCRTDIRMPNTYIGPDNHVTVFFEINRA